MAGWLDDFLSGMAASPIVPAGLLEMLGQPPVRRVGNPTGRELLQQQDFMGPPMPIPGSPGMTIPDVAGPAPQMITPAPPQEPSVPPSPFDTGAPAASYMFGGGLPPMELPAPSASPYFPRGARGADVPAAPPTAGAVAPAAQPSILGAIGRNILQGLQDNSNALIAGGGATMTGGLGRGFQAFAAASPLDIAARKERQGNEAIAATYQAVLQQQLSRGVAPAEARAQALAASQNKEILATLMGPQFQHVEIKGIGGDTQIGAFDPKTGMVYVGGKPVGAGTGVSGPDLPQGKEYLDKYVPKESHNFVKAAANYDVPVSGMGALKQFQQHILNYDPSFDASNYAAKVALKKNYLGGGKNYEELKAYEKIGNHLNTLKQAVENLDPSQVVGLNSLRNMFSDYGVSNPKVIALRNAMNAVNHELGNAYHGGHITNATLHAFQQNINDTMSIPGFKAGIGTMSELIHGIITSNENAFNNALPGEKGPKEFRALSEGTRQKFKNINDWSLGMEAPKKTEATQSAVPSGTQVGERRQFKQGWGVWNGQAWVPEK